MISHSVLFTTLLLIFGLFVSTPVAEAGTDDKRLVNVAGCQGCHRIDKRGSSLARPLLKLYRKFDKENFLEMLQNPPEGMPNYNHLSDEMRESIFTYFLTPSPSSKKKGSKESVPPKEKETQ